MAAENRTVGRFQFDIPAAPRGVPHIDVTLEVDARGAFTISAIDLAQAEGAQLRVTNSASGAEMSVRTRPK